MDPIKETRLSEAKKSTRQDSNPLPPFKLCQPKSGRNCSTRTIPLLSRAPLRVHVSQADGRLLWWMYTLQFSLELGGWSKIMTATSSGINWIEVVATIQGA